MAGFNFERDLPHQNAAVEAINNTFEGLGYHPSKTYTQNPILALGGNIGQLKNNLSAVQKASEIKESQRLDNPQNFIFDVSMETGTGKTYVYTKTIFELNKRFGLFKFIIAVPRVAIKAGTVRFLNSSAAREHFKLDFDDRQMKVYEVKSQTKAKNKKEGMPSEVIEFCRADSRTNTKMIHVLVINAGMINSPTMSKKFDVIVFDQFSVPFSAIAHCRPVLIIDEPHLFKKDKKTFENLRKVKPQFTLRYGATFNGEFENLVYQLNAVEAFNQDLVKGIVAHIETFDEGNNTTLKLINLGSEAIFELNENGVKKPFKLAKKDSLKIVHSEMHDLFVDDFNKTKLVLSNGLELHKGDTLNPYSYAETLQNKILQKAIKRHFEIEKALLSQSPRIKPLSLFFIDNIQSYRGSDGAMRVFFEQSLKAHLTDLIAKEQDSFYKQHLEKALHNIEKTHGGYFSKDNSDRDEAVEQETLEILHDKELLLDMENPRRFIFSKWTLREGWDNPNIFQICKLRSSGSETSKLQEVGRGLRLPVNEYMSRDKSQQHTLHYYVDFTESQFVEKLTAEINEKSGIFDNPPKLDDNLITTILSAYPNIEDKESLLNILDDKGIINRSNEFKERGYEQLKTQYPLAFKSGLKSGKVSVSGKLKPKATIRAGKYNELKTLWEAISQKVLLEYKFNAEQDFKTLFKSYLKEHSSQFTKSGSISHQKKIIVENNSAVSRSTENVNAEILPFRMMGYQAFITRLAKEISLSINMIHEVFYELLKRKALDINPYMSDTTIRTIKQGFNEYLVAHVFGKFTVNYKKISNSVHPTALTDLEGNTLKSIESSNVGVFSDNDIPPETYLFNEIFYDEPDLELNNIKNEITEVIVYTKIPKNSIRIPVVGGKTYSPDFAYVVKREDGRDELNLIVESKNKTTNNLSPEESQKIKHAEEFFSQVSLNIKVHFKTQLKSDKITDLIRKCSKPMRKESSSQQ